MLKLTLARPPRTAAYVNPQRVDYVLPYVSGDEVEGCRILIGQAVLHVADTAENVASAVADAIEMWSVVDVADKVREEARREAEREAKRPPECKRTDDCQCDFCTEIPF